MDCLARPDEAFADHSVAEAVYNATRAAEEDAVNAICAHRCATAEETAIKLRYLLRDTPIKDEIQIDQYQILVASFLPEGEGLADV